MGTLFGDLCPRIPTDFDDELGECYFASRNTDPEAVCQMYRKLFDLKVRNSTSFRVGNFCDEEARRMPRVMAHWQLMRQFVFTDCEETLTESGAMAIAQALDDGLVPALFCIS